MPPTIRDEAAPVREALTILLEPGQVVELRALGVRGPNGGRRHNEAGYWDTDHLDGMAIAAVRASRTARGVYFTLNPIEEQLLARCSCEMDDGGENSWTKDVNILRRRWLLVDCDPVRDSHIGSTDAEKAQALELITGIRTELAAGGWPAPILADSGNGYHLLYRVDLPAVDEGVTQRCLQALAKRYDTPKAHVDVSVYNPARICKVPGTWARKGSNTTSRPHRQGKLLDAPGELTAVPTALLHALAGPPASPGVSGGPNAGRQPTDALRGPRRPAGAWSLDSMPGRLDVERWLRDRGVPYEVSHRQAGDRTIYVLAACPFDPAHRSPDAAVMQAADGSLSANCFHSSCKGKGWAEFRDQIGRPSAEHYDRPAGGGESGSVAARPAQQARLSQQAQQANSGQPLQQSAPVAPVPPGPLYDPDAPPPAELRNFRWEAAGDNGALVAVGLPVQQVFRSLLALGRGWPQRVGDQLFVPDDAGSGHVRWLSSPNQLFSWAAHQLPNGNRNELEWARGRNMVTQAEFFEYTRAHAQAWEAVEQFPHEPPLPGHCYVHAEPTGGDGAAICALLDRFRPASECDRQLILAFFLSLLWGGLPGQRPAWVFTTARGDGRGFGKSKIAELGGRLVGGCIQVQQSEDIGDIQRRLLSPGGLSKRVTLLDNVKTLRFSWAELESLITASTISGRQMYTGEGRRPNILSWAITFNGAQFSRDLAQRCVIVHLDRPDYSGDWEGETVALVERHRWAIIGDLLALLQGPAADLKPSGRWAAWECQVLARVGQPLVCQEIIRARQEDTNDEQTEADMVKLAFQQALAVAGYDPDTAVVWFAAQHAADIVNEAMGERKAAPRAITHLYTLCIPEISRMRGKSNNRVLWKGTKSITEQEPTPFIRSPFN